MYAVNGHLANLDENGNLKDSGKSINDFKLVQQEIIDPIVSGDSITFIDSISQDTNGVITPTKKTVANATPSSGGVGGSAGLMTAADKEKLNGLINGSLFLGSPITTTTLSGNAALDIDDLKTMMRVVLSGSTNTITLPNGGENTFRFQIIVAQDGTGSRTLTITGASGVNVYNPSEFDFSSGSANQICVCTIIWDGTEYIYECTNYVGGE